MVIDRINNWFNLSKQYLFTYSNGFFNLSYLSNSPEVMLKSFSKMPFMKHDEKQQKLYADTPFVKGELYYVELEDGLWLMNSDMKYKNNVSYKPIYDKFLPVNYYSILLNSIENQYNTHSYEFNNFKIQNHSISFSKPGTDFLNCHFKGSKEVMHILYFNKDWADKNIIDSPTASDVIKDLLLSSGEDFLNFNYNEKTYEELIKKLSNSFRNSIKPDVFELKKLTYEYFDLFFESLRAGKNSNSHTLSKTDRIKIQKIDHHLKSNLHTKFPGIEELSKKYSISPTKLKENFKLLLGESIFKYFQHHKMQLALGYIKNEDLMIKDVAQKLGYENVSKFSKAFQKHHQKLPSEFRK